MTPAPFEQPFAHSIYRDRYQHPQDGNWSGTARRVAGAVMPSLLHAPKAASHVSEILNGQERVYSLIKDRKFIPGGRYLYSAGRDYHQVNNCLLLKVEDTREDWGAASERNELALMSGAGIGVWYGELRPGGSPIHRTGGVAGGSLGKMRMTNETGREIIGGGNRRGAIWAGLPWWHPEVFKFVTIKDWSDEIKALKAKDWNFPAPMDMTNISVTLDDNFLDAQSGSPLDPSFYLDQQRRYKSWGWDKSAETAPDGRSWQEWANDVYRTAVGHMLRHGEPGFTMDRGDRADEVLRNACTEITSADDSDVCNLGSLVLSRFDSPEQFGEAVRDGVMFLTAGTLYSDVPYDKVAEVREKNRRLGLGIIGLHEFLMLHGVRYGTPDAFEVLDPYMRQYARALEFAWDIQDRLDLSRSKGASAIAPNGTIGIVAESTPSADPLLTAAEERSVKVATGYGPDHYEKHVVVDPVALRALQRGVPVELIEDAYTLAQEPERRLAQTAYLQRFVDHAISGTANLPAPVTRACEAQAMGDKLLRYLPDVRGITFYPDGARSGQPRKPVPLDWALEQTGVVLETDPGRCQDGVCAV